MNYHCVKEFPAEPDPTSQDFRLISAQFRPKAALDLSEYSKYSFAFIIHFQTKLNQN